MNEAPIPSPGGRVGWTWISGREFCAVATFGIETNGVFGILSQGVRAGRIDKAARQVA